MNEVTLNECPEGLFWFEGILGFKSEYCTQPGHGAPLQCDAYVVASGEYFWGGAKSVEERGSLVVRPLHYETAVTSLNGDIE